MFDAFLRVGLDRPVSLAGADAVAA
jgi:hypothetical protein